MHFKASRKATGRPGSRSDMRDRRGSGTWRVKPSQFTTTDQRQLDEKIKQAAELGQTAELASSAAPEHTIEWDPDSLKKGFQVKVKQLLPHMLAHGTVLNMVTVKDLLEARVHFGHHQSVWNPKMEPYIYGVREELHIIDLEQTVAHLRRALDVLRHVAYNGGLILFVGNRSQYERLIRSAAMRCGEYFVTRKWTGGTLTNRMQTLKQDAIPDLMVCLTVPVSFRALRESYHLNIPSIGIIDTDQDPSNVTYVVPGNDDTPTAVELYCRLMALAVMEGKVLRSLGLPLPSGFVTFPSLTSDAFRQGLDL